MRAKTPRPSPEPWPSRSIHPSIHPSTPRRFSCSCTFGKHRCGLREGDRLHCDIKTATSRTWKIHRHLLEQQNHLSPPRGVSSDLGGPGHKGGSPNGTNTALLLPGASYTRPPPVSRVFLSLMWKTPPQEPQDGETRKRKRSVKPGSFGQALEKDGWKRLQATA